MTYPKVFTDLQRLVLDPLIPQIKALAPGEALSISTQSVSAAGNVRYLIYAWLSDEHSGLKDEFRIRSKFNVLTVERKTTPVISATRVISPQGEHPLLETIVHILDENDVVSEISTLGLSPEEATTLLNDWRKVHEL